MRDLVVSARGVGRAYRLYDRPQDRLQQLFARSTLYREFWALQDVSFDLARGTALGIIGRNGSGKSTLLEIVAGTLTPTVGEVTVNGRAAALLELGSGFNPEFTGRENVYLNGVILGLTRAEVERKFDEIVAFAEMAEFIDQPVKTYSTGMALRLAFAVVAAIDPQILIVDEAISVGDVFFQQRCFAKIRILLERGTTLLLASHDMAAIQNLCSEVIVLERGRVAWSGDPPEAVSRYYAGVGSLPAARPDGEPAQRSASPPAVTLPREEIISHSILPANGPRHGARGLELVAACVTDSAERHTLSAESLDTVTFHLLVHAHQPVAEPSAGIHLYDRLGNLVFAAGSRQWRHPLPSLAPGQELIVRIDLTLTVQPGEYPFSLGTAEPAAEGPDVGYVHDRREMLGPIVVGSHPHEVAPFYGIAQLPARISHAQLPAREG